MIETSVKDKVIWAFSDSLQMIKRSCKHIIKSMDQLMSAILMPVIFLLLFRYIFGGAIEVGNDINYVNFLVAGILVQTLAMGASTTTYNLAIDLQRGVIDRFRSLPMFRPALLIGHVVSDLARNMLSCSFMIAISYFVGFRAHASIEQWFFIISIMLMFSFAFSWLSAILGLLVKNLEAAQWVSFIVTMPLTFASSAFVPTDNMPSALKYFADNQPLSKVIECIRAWFNGQSAGSSAWLALAWCVAITVISIPIAVWLFKGYKSK